MAVFGPYEAGHARQPRATENGSAAGGCARGKPHRVLSRVRPGDRAAVSRNRAPQEAWPLPGKGGERRETVNVVAYWRSPQNLAQTLPGRPGRATAQIGRHDVLDL